MASNSKNSNYSKYSNNKYSNNNNNYNNNNYNNNNKGAGLTNLNQSLSNLNITNKSAINIDPSAVRINGLGEPDLLSIGRVYWFTDIESWSPDALQLFEQRSLDESAIIRKHMVIAVRDWIPDPSAKQRQWVVVTITSKVQHLKRDDYYTLYEAYQDEEGKNISLKPQSGEDMRLRTQVIRGGAASPIRPGLKSYVRLRDPILVLPEMVCERRDLSGSGFELVTSSIDGLSWLKLRARIDQQVERDKFRPAPSCQEQLIIPWFSEDSGGVWDRRLHWICKGWLYAEEMAMGLPGVQPSTCAKRVWGDLLMLLECLHLTRPPAHSWADTAKLFSRFGMDFGDLTDCGHGVGRAGVPRYNLRSMCPCEWAKMIRALGSEGNEAPASAGEDGKKD